jgi:diketogulonate reductase-like aldo/keto reductase
VYNTEPELGLAIQQSGVVRDELFLTTKAASIKNIEAALESSLHKLKTGYVDLYVNHEFSG